MSGGGCRAQTACNMEARLKQQKTNGLESQACAPSTTSSLLLHCQHSFSHLYALPLVRKKKFLLPFWRYEVTQLTRFSSCCTRTRPRTSYKLRVGCVQSGLTSSPCRRCRAPRNTRQVPGRPPGQRDFNSQQKNKSSQNCLLTPSSLWASHEVKHYLVPIHTFHFKEAAA